MNIFQKLWLYLLGINNNTQYLFWYRYKDSNVQNFGDLIGAKLLEVLSNIQVKHIDDKPSLISSKHIPHYLSAGSIIATARKSSIVWGSGIINMEFGIDKKASYLAVRGPRTRQRILALGGSCPETYGDPALLLPLIFSPPKKKIQKLTIIPHYVDYEAIKNSLITDNNIDVIDMMTDNFERTLCEISSSNFIISSSLHGLILATAYNIPCLWVEFSNKIFGDDTKYYDFFESLDIQNITKLIISNPQNIISLPTKEQAILAERKYIANLQKGLLQSYPFPIINKEIQTHLSIDSIQQ